MAPRLRPAVAWRILADGRAIDRLPANERAKVIDGLMVPGCPCSGASMRPRLQLARGAAQRLRLLHHEPGRRGLDGRAEASADNDPFTETQLILPPT